MKCVGLLINLHFVQSSQRKRAAKKKHPEHIDLYTSTHTPRISRERERRKRPILTLAMAGPKPIRAPYADKSMEFHSIRWHLTDAQHPCDFSSACRPHCEPFSLHHLPLPIQSKMGQKKISLNQTRVDGRDSYVLYQKYNNHVGC